MRRVVLLQFSLPLGGHFNIRIRSVHLERRFEWQHQDHQRRDHEKTAENEGEPLKLELAHFHRNQLSSSIFIVQHAGDPGLCADLSLCAYESRRMFVNEETNFPFNIIKFKVWRRELFKTNCVFNEQGRASVCKVLPTELRAQASEGERRFLSEEPGQSTERYSVHTMTVNNAKQNLIILRHEAYEKLPMKKHTATCALIVSIRKRTHA